ncbi:MAG: MFS transporter [Proteobacteria bacterium]|nr:MFS transporter [Pseudomonadota bacterium]
MTPEPARPPDRPASGSTRALIEAIATISVMGLATGLTLPLVSLRLLEAGASPGLIAVLAALPALGTIATSFVLDRLTQRFGARRLLLAGVLLSLGSILVLTTPYALVPWALSRVALGVSAGILFALGEARILETSSAAARGRWTGLYATTLTACQFAGPALLAVLGTHARAPIVAAVVLHLASCALLARSDWRANLHAEEGALPPRVFLRHCLPLAAAVLYFAMFDSTALALLPLYGLGLGLAAKAAVLSVSVVFLGDSCLQIPLGWAADRFGRASVHLTCALVCAGGAIALAFGLARTPALWPMLFLIGGTAGALYTLAIVRIGDRFRGRPLIAANAYVGTLWGAGSLSGPLLATAAMQAAPPQGLMLFIGAGAAVCAALMARPGAPLAKAA